MKFGLPVMRLKRSVKLPRHFIYRDTKFQELKLTRSDDILFVKRRQIRRIGALLRLVLRFLFAFLAPEKETHIGMMKRTL